MCLLPLRDNKWYDYSGNGNHGTIHGATKSSNGRHGFSWLLDGLDDYVDCGNDTSLDITDAITVEVWINPASSWANHKTVLAKRANDNTNYMIQYEDKLTFFFYNGDWVGGGFDANPEPSVGRWAHVVATYDKINIKTYFNGEIDTTTPKTTSMLSNTGDLYLGYHAGGASTKYFDGIIDGVRIYDRAFAPHEIKALYEWGL